MLFNKFMEQEATPESWSAIIVKMLYKNKGSKTSPEKYRPIAIINYIVKIFIQILSTRISKWCEMNNIIPEWQSGFRRGRSCLDNIFL